MKKKNPTPEVLLEELGDFPDFTEEELEYYKRRNAFSNSFSSLDTSAYEALIESLLELEENIIYSIEDLSIFRFEERRKYKDVAKVYLEDLMRIKQRGNIYFDLEEKMYLYYNNLFRKVSPRLEFIGEDKFKITDSPFYQSLDFGQKVVHYMARWAEEYDRIVALPERILEHPHFDNFLGIFYEHVCGDQYILTEMGVELMLVIIGLMSNISLGNSHLHEAIRKIRYYAEIDPSWLLMSTPSYIIDDRVTPHDEAVAELIENLRKDNLITEEEVEPTIGFLDFLSSTAPAPFPVFTADEPSDGEDGPKNILKKEFIDRLTSKLLKHTRLPEGVMGEYIGKYMAKDHAEVLAWGMEPVIINPSDTILDIGFGAGESVKLMGKFATQGKIYGIDYSEVMVKLATSRNKALIAQGRAELIHAPVSSIPYPDNMFDKATAVVTTHFWPDPNNDFKEVFRVLRPGGIFFVINNNFKDDVFKERHEIWKEKTGARVYTIGEMETFFKNAGFADIKIRLKKELNYITIEGEKPKLMSDVGKI